MNQFSLSLKSVKFKVYYISHDMYYILHIIHYVVHNKHHVYITCQIIYETIKGRRIKLHPPPPPPRATAVSSLGSRPKQSQDAGLDRDEQDAKSCK